MKAALIQTGLTVIATALIVGMFVDSCNDRQHGDEVAALNNKLAAAESTRQVAEGVWARRMFVVTEDLRMTELDRLGALEEVEKLELQARGLYNLALDYRTQLVGATSARPDSTDTVIPIDLAEGSAHARGDVRLKDFHVPATVPIDVALEVWIDRLLLALAIGEAADGSLTAVAKSTDPNVKRIEIDGITDLRSTGLTDAKPSRMKWFGIGGAVGAALCLFFCGP